MSKNEITFQVDDTFRFVKWLNTRFEQIYPKLAFSEFAALIPPEFDPRIDKNDPYEKYKVPDAATFINRHVFMSLERGKGELGNFTIRCKSRDFEEHYNWLLAEFERFGWLPAPGQVGGDELKNRLMELYPKAWKTALEIIELDRREPELDRWQQAHRLNIGVDTYESWITKLSKAGLIKKRRT